MEVLFASGYVQGSNDGFTTYENIYTFSDWTGTDKDIEFPDDIGYFKSLRVYNTQNGGGYQGNYKVHTLQFYGRELTVKQASAPTDGREYVHIGSDYYTEDWGEKEFAAGSTRKTIYDHGVELEEITSDPANDGFTFGSYTLMPSTKTDHSIKSIGTGSNLSSFATKNVIDFSNESYNSLHVRVVGGVVAIDNSCVSVTLNSSKAIISSSISALNGVFLENQIDISSVHTDAYLFAQSSSGRQSIINEIWLE